MLDMIASGPIGSRNVEWDITFGPSLRVVGQEGIQVLVGPPVRDARLDMFSSRLGTWGYAGLGAWGHAGLGTLLHAL